jgi:hypothetical protein
VILRRSDGQRHIVLSSHQTKALTDVVSANLGSREVCCSSEDRTSVAIGVFEQAGGVLVGRFRIQRTANSSGVAEVCRSEPTRK